MGGFQAFLRCLAIAAESDAIHRVIIENLEGGTFRPDRHRSCLRGNTVPFDAPR